MYPAVRMININHGCPSASAMAINAASPSTSATPDRNPSLKAFQLLKRTVLTCRTDSSTTYTATLAW